MGEKDARRGLLEKVLLLVVFLGLLGFVTGHYVLESKVQKQDVVKNQLLMMRQGVSLFKMIEHRYPESLIELAQADYKMPNDQKNRRYVDNLPLKDNKVVDPFGNPYAYNKARGFVSSATAGYESW